MAIQKDPEERKEEIIQTAKHLFSEKGYKSTQIKDIVAEIGVAQGLFYYYFKSKEEVMEAVAEEYADNIINKIKYLAQGSGKPSEKLFNIFDIFIDNANRQSSLLAEIQTADNGVIHERVFMCVAKKLIPFVVEIVEEGNRIGEFDCAYLEQTSQIVVNGIFKLLSEMPGMEKIDYLMKNLEIMKSIILRVYGYKGDC